MDAGCSLPWGTTTKPRNPPAFQRHLFALEIFDPEDGGTEQDGLPITFWTYIREMFVSILCMDTGYHEDLVVLLSPSNKMQGYCLDHTTIASF
jgi:hypothetical protein